MLPKDRCNAIKVRTFVDLLHILVKRTVRDKLQHHGKIGCFLAHSINLNDIAILWDGEHQRRLAEEIAVYMTRNTSGENAMRTTRIGKTKYNGVPDVLTEHGGRELLNGNESPLIATKINGTERTFTELV
jgi:hypothetical protein